jgi:hypothetical protein
MLRRIILVASLFFVAVVLTVYFFTNGNRKAESCKDGAAVSTTDGQAASSGPVKAGSERISSGALQDMPLAMAIVEAEEAIANGADAKTVLDALRAKLLAADPKAASAAICAYLASGRNVPTGMPFVVGADGSMASVTSLRAYLLDLLLTVDPQAALAEAEAVFDAKTSADEYAICLRNVGKIDTGAEGRAYVAKRARELLSSGLASNPTAGFVEAFDAVVYAGDARDLELLAGYTGKDKGMGLNLPAFMAMDRMVIDNPEDTLQALLAKPSMLDERPLTRAGFFARADLSDGKQLAEVEQYVQSLNPSSEEAQYYFSLFPNVNFTLTDGILTVRLSFGADYVRTRYEAALDAVNTWMGDSNYARYKSQLESARARLEEQLGK